MDSGPAGAGIEEVETLQVMAGIHLAARGVSPGPHTGAGTRSDVEALSASALTSVHAARVALDGVYSLGPTRFAFPKRVLLRIAPIFTHRIVAAVRALADSLDAMARVQRDQVAYVQRMNDSMRAMVVSADLAITDAVDRVSTDPGTRTSGGAEVDEQVTLLSAHLRELEIELTQTQRELAALQVVVAGVRAGTDRA